MKDLGREYECLFPQRPDPSALRRDDKARVAPGLLRLRTPEGNKGILPAVLEVSRYSLFGRLVS